MGTMRQFLSKKEKKTLEIKISVLHEIFEKLRIRMWPNYHNTFFCLPFIDSCLMLSNAGTFLSTVLSLTLNSSLIFGLNCNNDRDCPGIGGILMALVMSISDFCDSEMK